MDELIYTDCQLEIYLNEAYDHIITMDWHAKFCNGIWVPMELKYRVHLYSGDRIYHLCNWHGKEGWWGNLKSYITISVMGVQEDAEEGLRIENFNTLTQNGKLLSTIEQLWKLKMSLSKILHRIASK